MLLPTTFPHRGHIDLTHEIKRSTPPPTQSQTTSKHKLEVEKAWKHGYELRRVHTSYTLQNC